MQVFLDLRPRHMVAYQSRRVDAPRVLYAILLLVFITVSACNILLSAGRYAKTRQELIEARGELDRVRMLSADIAARTGEMQEFKTKVTAYLEFTREELPAVEFMKALEDAVPPGLKISALSVRPGGVMMAGSALSDEEIIALSSNLGAMGYIVAKVDAPITAKSILGAKQISDFRLTCDIRKILDIAAESGGR